jgi:2-polyprenyl-6-methoxyphenol hydroxylase-like FAD-dependent oxidoreductase
MFEADIIVVGAGPVGMLAALLAAQRGLSVLLLEQAEQRDTQSRAIGITPPSLEILETLGLAETFISHGIAVRRAEAHGRSLRLGNLDFSGLAGSYPFVLAIPQDSSAALLEQTVLAARAIRFLRGHRVTFCSESGNLALVSGKRSNGVPFRFSGQFLLACDGGKSTVRGCLGIPFLGAPDRNTFLMGDFADSTGWGDKALFFFTPRGSVESFPLPGGKRRYVLPTPHFIKEYTSDYLTRELLLRAGIDVSGDRQFWESAFGVQRFTAESFCRGRFFLCGDAAHLMSPVGGQNMNSGFADAELAVWLIASMQAEKWSAPQVCALYDNSRQRAVRVALRRARWMMQAGTSGGHAWSALRNLTALLLLHTPLRHGLARLFSMQSIPGRNLRSLGKVWEKELES